MKATDIISLLSGVALFLFGMSLMGDGLKKVAGSKLEIVLYKLTGTPFKGVLLGTGVTAVIQSSSATSVMVVGFVNSGMMKLKQAISVILGSILGTSITGWIISLSEIGGAGGVASLLSTATISGVVAVVGIVLHMFSKKQSRVHVGDILLGFAVLMFGMQTMSAAVAPLKQSAAFISLLTRFSNPLLGILVGIVFTAILQSASAAVGILQALSATGAVTFDAAFPIILGIAIGAAVPVLLSALGAKTEGRRTALAYLAIELIGVVLTAVIFYGLNMLTPLPFTGKVMTAVSIALVNTLFRLFNVAVLLPFIGLITRLVCTAVPDDPREKELTADIERLEERFLRHPALAVEQSRLTVESMARKSRQNVLDAVSLLNNFSEEGFRRVDEMEDVIDRYEDKVGTYLVKLNMRELNARQTDDVSKYLHTISDFERMSDHAENLAEIAREIRDKSIKFSADGEKEIKTLTSAVTEVMDIAVNAFIANDVAAAYRVEPLEELIDCMCDEMKMRHIERLKSGECSINVGFVFNDIISNYERVADHCSNIAVAMIELQSDEFDTHGYLLSLKEKRSNNFDRYFEEYSKKYIL